MEPFEWLVLGIGLAVGGLFGANSKTVMRTTARAYMTVGEKTRGWSANMREDFHDAVEEARYEREQAEYEAEREEEPKETKANSHTRARAPRKPTRTSAKSHASRNASAEPSETA